MGAWAALIGRERTEEQLQAQRKEVADLFKIESFTCDACPARRTCDFAFDAYNTDGDCLAEK